MWIVIYVIVNVGYYFISNKKFFKGWKFISCNLKLKICFLGYVLFFWRLKVSINSSCEIIFGFSFELVILIEVGFCLIVGKGRLFCLDNSLMLI